MDFSELKAKDFLCSCCNEILKEPMTLVCGDTFCGECVDKMIVDGSTCLICKCELSDNTLGIKNNLLKNIIDKVNKEYKVQNKQSSLESFVVIPIEKQIFPGTEKYVYVDEIVLIF